MSRFKNSLAALFILFLIATACSQGATGTPATKPATTPPSATLPEPSSTSTIESTQVPPAPQPSSTPVSIGPNAEDFPADYNPLTGQRVNDASTLKLPALLISISNFPVTARPQAGLSFADYVFEIYITEGATRFLSVFYGDFPKPEVPVTGGCDIRMEAFAASNSYLGNRVWLDVNANGVQDQGEPGVGGVCVNLYDASGQLLSQTTTDSNGYYGFNVSGGTYSIEIIKPEGMKFSPVDVGNEDHDSDADQTTGRMEANLTALPLLSLDAGLIPPVDITPTPNPAVKPIEAGVGPVRSGRLVYADVAGFFQDSCLVYAFASEEVLVHIPQCAMVTHQVEGGGYMLDLTHMRQIAEKNTKPDSLFNYASNAYTDLPPLGGSAATKIDVFFAYLNQSGWKYDALTQSYLRYTDNADKASAGQLHPDTDRLNGRQLHFENVIILFAEHDVISATNLDIHLEQGETGPAILFRDGKMYEIRWSTRSGAYEKETGLRRPIQWLDNDGNPFPLKPGHTWVTVVTPYSTVSDQGAGSWKVRFYAPAGAQ